MSAHGDVGAVACPIHRGDAPRPVASNGCPVSERAAAFDPFAGPYQADPADALRWSRDREPVFYAPALGYWVISRHADIKAVFRDPVLFSPRNALDKITPVSHEATDALAGYGYAMNRTLVNEDEPVHTERRRALMEHFLPERLAAHEPMVRRLVEERIDALIDRGRADLVDAMLWEVPLTVALHFLGVPEEDMETLRRFSIAHTVNTWGRPSPEQQVEVAHAVGRFWHYAGTVLEKMRAEPDGPGWMHFAIRENARNPEVVTDSYLHSMMMAIIVAAHETTAHAAANAIKLLLTDGEAWEELCADPSLIPNAAEECLRYAGSVVAWRREATDDAVVGGVAIPAGAKLLIVQASGNRDERRFEDAERFDIRRDDAADHLTFGYGAHQCMGKNLARMEMRVFLEALTRRLPHMRLVADQRFTYLPNTSFRGPDHLWVEWDPAANPERRDPTRRQPRASFAIGAPSRRDVARTIRVAETWRETADVLGVRLEDPRGRPLPAWSAGAHVELCLGGHERSYSLCGPPDDGAWSVAILREAEGRGGSRHFHEALRPGATLRLRGPRNRFALNGEAARHVLVAGGIGITPILAMADRLRAEGGDYALHYAGRSRAAMAFAGRVERDHGARATLYPGDEGRRVDLAALTAPTEPGTQIYACGPDRMIAALRELMTDAPDALRFEHFASDGAALDPTRETGFDVDLLDSGLSLHVPPDRSLLDALRGAGVDVASDCEEGLCGFCEVEVAEGLLDHRDRVLSAAERDRGNRMMSCCSRAKDGARLKLAL